MNDLYEELLRDYKEWLKEFIVWYKDNYKQGIEIKILLNLHQDYSLSILHVYLNKVYGIGILADPYTYYVYIITPELKVNEILARYKSNGEFTHVIITDTNTKKANVNTVFKRAILKVLEEIHNEF
jgi:hypothetical protein